MTRGSRLGTRRAIALVGGLSLVVACGSPRAPSPETRVTSSEPSPPSVSLPDISGASAPVQQQLRDAFAGMQRRTAVTAAPLDRAAAYGDMGRLFLATEYLDAAETCFANAQTLQPSALEWPYYLAHIQRRRNDPEKAAALFERVLQLDPNHVAALVWLGDVRLVQGRPEAAEPLLAKAMSLAPREAAALDRAGRAALARRDYAAAVKDLAAALELRPQASAIHYPLSLAYRGLGDARKADAELKLRGDVDVSPADPLMEQVGALLQNASAAEVSAATAMAEHRWTDAITSLRQAIALSPDNAFTHLNLGTALFQTGNAGAALGEFQTAVRLSPGLSKAHYGLGIVLEAAARDREALAEFSKAVETEPSSVEARMSLADALRRLGRDKESLPHYADVIARSPAVSQAHFGQAMALVRLGRYRDARARLENAVTTYPDQPGFTHALARLLAAAPDDAVRDGARATVLVNALLQTQRTLELMQTMAMALAESGRFDEAVLWQQQALAAAAQANRGDLARRLSENLKLYENRQPCRTPWPADDPVFKPRPAP